MLAQFCSAGGSSAKQAENCLKRALLGQDSRARQPAAIAPCALGFVKGLIHLAQDFFDALLGLRRNLQIHPDSL